MKSFLSFIRIPLSMICLLSFLSVSSSSAQDQNAVSSLKVDANTAVRFFFKPPNANYIRPALIFRVADEGSSNWNTAPIDHYGRSAYISLEEMRTLVHQLDSDGLLWRVSATNRSIEPFMELPIGENLMVTIYAPDGTATASISAKKICKSLSRLNNAIEMKRAHWELEYFRRGCGCQVPGYKSDAYPNDR